MSLPTPLVSLVREGRVVLFLGAGATFGARVDGDNLPDAETLRDRIAERFLPSHYGDQSLAWVAELAASATDLFEVQDFIAEQFRDPEPAPFHALIPTFVWRGLATTNYDRLVEVVYARADAPSQHVVPFLGNQDRVDQQLRDRSALAFLKLHGCVTRTHDESLPLVLSLDQYASYRDNRFRLSRMFEEWAIENAVVFVGHRIQDPNLRGILLGLTKDFPSRPRYYLVRPDVDAVESAFWAAKNVTVLDHTFESFLKALDSQIDSRMRGLVVQVPADHPIVRRFITSGSPSPGLAALLNTEFEYLHEGIAVDDADPKQFYRGAGLGWFPIANDLDVRRRLADQVLEDVVLRPEDDRPSTVELYAIKAEAGAGKSVLLRRIAWDAAIRADALCLYHLDTWPQSLEPVRELAESTGERLFVFIDNAAQNLVLIRDIIRFSRNRDLRVTVVTTERTNEWNMSCKDLEEYLSDAFVLHYLSEAEIEQLVGLLEEHDSLGPNLIAKSVSERIEEFTKRAGRQLLVALHEATLGRPFEEILVDEYENLVPREAQSVYLTVCALNRLRVPVRAGVISRIHGIPFEEFRQRLFAPLEHVVFVVELPWGDYGYRTRHSEIAQIVFDRVLEDPVDRYNEYSRVLRALNPIYSVDLSAVRDMIRAKSVFELFPNHADALAIYNSAFEVLPRDAYLLQQRANYERIRPDGNLKLAEQLLHEARTIDPSDSSIAHTLAEVLRAKAEEAQQPLERTKYRGEAESVLRSVDAGRDSDRYAIVTRLKLAADEVGDILADERTSDRQLDDALRRAERAFESARQRYPGDQHILAAEASFAGLLSDHERSYRVLEAAREANPRDPFIASQLCAVLRRRGELERAREYLKAALESNAGDKHLNFQYAEVLRDQGEGAGTLAYYYRRAFTKWDGNYESQFWFARYAYESDDSADVDEAKAVFKRLRNAPVPHDERIRVRDLIGGLDSPRRFSGSVSRVEATHGFVRVDGRGDWVFFHQSDMASETWDDLRAEVRITFSLGFSLRGPKAVDIGMDSG